MGIPIKEQLLRSASIDLPPDVEPAAFIGKNGSFMKELKARCCVHGVGYIKRMHLEPVAAVSQSNRNPAEGGTENENSLEADSEAQAASQKPKYRIDFLASEG